MNSIEQGIEELTMEASPFDILAEESHAEYCDILEERLCSFYIENKLSEPFKELVEVASLRFEHFKNRKYREYEDALWLTLPQSNDHKWISKFIDYFFE